MKRMKFDSNGRLFSVDDTKVEISDDNDEYEGNTSGNLKRSDSLEFLKDEVLQVNERPYWSLYSGDKLLEPLKFSNGKTQEDVVKEVVDLAKAGNKIIFIHGVCGTGKSAIALNIARVLGRASIVVPLKGLQRQYEEDYMGRKYLVKNGKKMKIAMITGRDNHDSIIKPGVSCSDAFLPDTIKITEKNYGQLYEYYQKNPLIKNRVSELDIKNLKRISIAPANPYWSPILPGDFEFPLRDAKKKKYRGLQGKDFIFYHRKQGCSYFDQYESYINADVIIFNSAKYKIENALDRKPATEVEIIDEADEFLDNFSTQSELNLNRLQTSLKNVFCDSPETQVVVDSIIELITLEEKNKQALGINEDTIFNLKETQLDKILRLVLKNPELEVEVSLDEMNYANKMVETAHDFKDFLDDTYLTFKKKENDLIVSLVTTNLSKKFQEIVSKNKLMVLMSGTLHSESVLKNIYGIDDFKLVEAEGYQQGSIEIHRTGKEIDCRYSNLSSGKHTRGDYLNALSKAVEKAQKPMLVHVNAFEDLPTREELAKYEISNIMPREVLQELQLNDKTGKLVSLFKSKLSESLYSTKCSRGVDFPGDICNSVVFTKYPNPNVRGVFWKILQKTHGNYYWDFYRDKAKREFLQRIYRAVRSKEDKVFVLSPDSRVLEAVRNIQVNKQ